VMSFCDRGRLHLIADDLALHVLRREDHAL
jgi:hypothetical protein